MLADELQIAKDLALKAGTILLEYYQKDPSVRWKGKGDPVTSADYAASRFLVSELRRLFPGDGVLSEEERDDLQRLNRQRVWIVDPMDGTAEFLARRDEFAVMVGLAIDGTPALGAVYQPAVEKLYYGGDNIGAFLEQKSVQRPLSVSTESDPSRLTIVVSRSHDSADDERIRRELRIQRLVRMGSAGLKIGYICEGAAHLYFHIGAGTKLWDTCAPEAILRAAGGRVTDAYGAPITYNTAELRNARGLIASNGTIHDDVVRAVSTVRTSSPDFA